MKYIVFMICCCFCLLTFSTTAQNTEYSYKMTGKFVKGSVPLRWTPLNYESWKHGIKVGYKKIKRITIKQNGKPLSVEDQINSVIDLNIRTFPIREESEWQNYLQSDIYGIVAGCMLGDSIEVLDIANNDIASVKNAIDTRNTCFGYSMLACDQDFKLAELAALGTIDHNVEGNGSTYLYTLVSWGLDGREVDIAHAFVEVSENTEPLPPPVKIIATGFNGKITLTWDKQSQANLYSGWIIERRGNDGIFKIIHDGPVISISLEDNGTEPIVFTDKIDENGYEYTYFISGKTIYGEIGERSDKIFARGKSDPIDVSPMIDSIKEIDTGMLTIYWELINARHRLNEIQYLELYWSKTIDGQYKKMMEIPAYDCNGTFQFNEPGPSNYFYVTIVDLNGNVIPSLTMLGQIKDEIPPAAPVALNGSCDKTGLVKVGWQPDFSMGEDIKGYMVFFSNNGTRDSSLAQLSESYVNDTTYSFQINLKTLSDSIFVAVMALDYRDNQSPMSVILPIQRYDITPPGAPVISSVLAYQDSLVFSLVPSPSNDVIAYTFEYLPQNSRDWVVLHEFSQGRLPSTYSQVNFSRIDGNFPDKKIHNYRLVAKDDAQLSSSSNLVKAKILSGLRDSIIDLNISYAPNPNQSGGLGSNSLKWCYPQSCTSPFDYDPDLLGFQIYRGADSIQTMRAYKFLPLSSNHNSVGNRHFFEDYDLEFTKIHVQMLYNTIPTSGPVVVVPPRFVSIPNPRATTGGSGVIGRGRLIFYQVQAVYVDGSMSPITVPHGVIVY
jgi:hypothetical protein